MMRKILVTAALGGLLTTTVPAAMFAQDQDQGQPSQQAQKSVTGKVLNIGDNGHSFTVESNDGSTKAPMKFVIDKNTKVEGQVKVGTMVLVDYQPTDGGPFLCIRVAAQQS